MQKIITVSTPQHNILINITTDVEDIMKMTGVNSGLISVYVQGAMAGIIIMENWGDSVPNEEVSLLKRLIPAGVWEHDVQDNNGESHLKAGLVGPGETIPIVSGKMGLSTW